MKSQRIVMVCVAALAVCMLLSSVSFAQPGRGRGGPGFFDRGGLGLLMDEQVRKELEIVPEQEEKLRALGEKIRDDMRELFSGMRDLSSEERQAKFAEIRETMQERMAAMQEEANKILLPQQVERLGQIRMQSRMRRMGTAGALGSEELVKELGITEEQKKRLEELRPQLEKELQEKIAKARDEVRDKLLEVLTPTQRDKLEKMIGEQFESQRREGGFRGRSGGSTGGT